MADRSLDAEIRYVLGLYDRPLPRRLPRFNERDRFDARSVDADTTSDIIIMNSAILSRYKSRDAKKLMNLRRGRKLLVVITEQSVTKIIEALQAADGVVFHNSNMHHLPMIVALMEENLISVPSDILSVMLERGLRRKILLSLTWTEQRALSLLGHGCTNSIIAAKLDISEGRAKYLIRSLLKKLLLQNRTQAAVFAAREIKLIDAPSAQTTPHGETITL